MIGFASMASELVLIPSGSLEKVKEAFSYKDLTIHLYNDQYVIGTIETALPVGYIVLDENAWDEGEYYFVLKFNPAERESYVSSVSKSAKVLHQESDFLVVSIARENLGQLYPSIHGGMVRISQNPARSAGKQFGLQGRHARLQE